MPVLNVAVLTAVRCCRHNLKEDFGDKILFEEFSTKEEADASFRLLKRILEMGADIHGKESRGTDCVGRLCRTAEEYLPNYSWGEHKVSETAVVTPEWRQDLSRIFLLLKEYGANFDQTEVLRYKEEAEHPINGDYEKISVN